MCDDLVVKSNIVVMVMVFIWSRGPHGDRPMCFPYTTYCVRITFRMLQKYVFFDRFGDVFYDEFVIYVCALGARLSVNEQFSG